MLQSTEAGCQYIWYHCPNNRENAELLLMSWHITICKDILLNILRKYLYHNSKFLSICNTKINSKSYLLVIVEICRLSKVKISIRFLWHKYVRLGICAFIIVTVINENQNLAWWQTFYLFFSLSELQSCFLDKECLTWLGFENGVTRGGGGCANQ